MPLAAFLLVLQELPCPTRTESPLLLLSFLLYYIVRQVAGNLKFGWYHYALHHQGKIMADTAMEAKDTPLQEKLEEMATRIGYFGFAFAILTFIAMVVSYKVSDAKLIDEYPTWQSYVTRNTTSATARIHGLKCAQVQFVVTVAS